MKTLVLKTQRFIIETKSFINLENSKLQAKNKELANEILKTNKVLDNYKVEFNNLASELDKYEQLF